MRYTFIDTARGIAILLVVLGHCFSSAECGMNKLILSFHMPLFFFLSGIFAKPLAFNQLWGGVKHKVRLLLIPQLILSLSLIVLNGGLWLADGNSIKNFDIVSCFFYWFLLVLFSCAVLFMIVSSITDLKRWITRVVIFLTISFCIVLSFRITIAPVLYWVRIIPTAFLFYFAGFLLKDRVLDNKSEHTSWEGLKVLFLTATLFVLSQVNAPVKMYENEYGHYSLFLLTSVFGIYIVISLAKLMQSAPLLEEMGRISIAIYTWNFLIIGVVYRLTNRLLVSIEWVDKGIITGITFGFSLLLLYIFSKFTYNRMPFLHGIKQKKKS